MNISRIRAGLKTRLETISGLRAYDLIPDDVAPPAAVVMPDTPVCEYSIVANRGTVTLHFRVTLIASRTSVRSGQDLLDGWLSTGTAETSSVVDALYADTTLGGAASSLVVSTAEDYGPITVGSIDYLTADLLVAVHATR